MGIVHQDDEPMTWGDFRKQRRRLLQLIAEAQQEASDAFAAAETKADDQAAFWNEHEVKINRIQRQIRRMLKSDG
jgi:hypothetical protein